MQLQLSDDCSKTSSSTVVQTDRSSVDTDTDPISLIRALDLSSVSTHPQSACEPSFPGASHAAKDLGSVPPPAPSRDTKYLSTLPRTQTHGNTSLETSRATQHTASITGPINSPLNRSALRGARAYTHVAILLFIIMVIYWVPSTVNRAYSFNHPPSFGLNLAAASVLPLQGFFNCIIYCFTSRSQLKEIWCSARERWWHKSPVVRGSVGSMAHSSDLLHAPNAERRTGRQNQLSVMGELALKYGLDDLEDCFPANAEMHKPPHMMGEEV